MPVPTDPTNFAVTSATANSISLSWTPGTGQTFWMLSQFDGAHNHLFRTLTIDLTVEPNVNTAVFGGLDSDTSSIFRLQAFNGSGSSNFIEAAGATLASPADNRISVSGTTFNGDGSLAPGQDVHFRLSELASGLDGLFGADKVSVTSDESTAVFQINLLRGCTYVVRYHSGKEVPITIPAEGDSFEINVGVLGRPGVI